MRVSVQASEFTKVRVLRHAKKGERGLSFDPTTLNIGEGNSGFQALNLATLLGASRVVLLGYDMGHSGKGRRHWHGDHPSGMNNPEESNFTRWRTGFAEAVPDLKKAGVEVVNCSRQTTLECFPRATLEDVLSRL